MRLTPDTASPSAKGQTASLERWVEFVKGGKVVGREVVTIIPQAEIVEGAERHAAARRTASKVETLKGGDYMRRVDQPRRKPLPDALPGLAHTAITSNCS